MRADEDGDFVIDSEEREMGTSPYMYNRGWADLEEDYGITEIPDGYVVHHDVENGILQLVDENIHAEFTHIGGHSIYNNGE